MASSTVRRAGRRLPVYRLLAFIGFCLFAGISVFVNRQFPVFTMLPVGATAGFGLYTLLGPTRRGASVEFDLSGVALVDHELVPRVLTVGFLFVSSFAVVSLNWGHYTKPIAYYVAIAIAAVIIVLRVLFTETRLSNLLLAGVLGAITFGSNQIVYFGEMGGPDDIYHIRHVAHIVQTGYVNDGTTYADFPGKHAGPAVLAHFADISPDIAYRATGLLIMLFGVAITYIVVRQLSNQEIAVLAAVFYVTMSVMIFRGGKPVQMAHHLPVAFLVFMSLIYLFYTPTYRWGLVFILFAASLVVRHHYTTFVTLLMVGTLVVAWIGRTAYHHTVAGSTERSMSFRHISIDRPTWKRGWLAVLTIATLFGVYIVFMTTYLRSMVGWFVEFFFSIGSSPKGLEESSRFGTIEPDIFYINTVGDGLLIALVVLGVLMHLRHRNSQWLVIAVWAGVSAALAGLGFVIDFPFVIPQRVYALAQMTALGLLAASGVWYLARYAASKPRAAAALATGILVVMVGSFVFFSAASTIAAFETSPFNEDVPHPIHYEITEEEAAKEFVAIAEIERESVTRVNRMSPNEDGTIDYSGFERGDSVLLGEQRLQSGIKVSGGSGIGSVEYAPVSAPRQGLETAHRVYAGQQLEIYRNL